MKKLLFIMVACVLYTCSSSETSQEEDCLVFNVTIEAECQNQDTRTSYEVTETVYNTIQDDIKNDPDFGKNPCIWVAFRNISNQQKQGYYRSGGKSNCE